MGRSSEEMKAAWADPVKRGRMLKRPRVRAEKERREQIDASGEATCSGPCKRTLPIGDFPSGRNNRDGQKRYAYCKVCHCEKQRELRMRNHFNLTIAEYDLIFAHQQGVCAICHQPPKKMRLAVDHDHHSGLVRGLLCAFCNRAIAIFRDDTARLERALNYLQQPPATAALGTPRFGLKGRVSNKAATRNRLNRKHPGKLFD